MSQSALPMPPLMKARIAARLLLLQARWDPARMQGAGFAFAVDPWLAVCWAGDADGLRAARRRHLEYFNTHPIAAWLTAGVVCRLEAAAAVAPATEREATIARIRALKTTLSASLAALYDSFFWGCLRPVSALAGLLAAQVAFWRNSPHAPAWGVATALVVYNVPGFVARFTGLLRGLDAGEGAVAQLCGLPAQGAIRLMRRAVVVGAVVCFAIGAILLGASDRVTAVLTFAAGLYLSRRGVSPVAQLGFAGAGGLAANFVGLWP